MTIAFCEIKLDLLMEKKRLFCKKFSIIFMLVSEFYTFSSDHVFPKRVVSSSERATRESRLKFRLRRYAYLFVEITINYGNTQHEVTNLGSALGLISDYDAQAVTLKGVNGVHRPLLVPHVPELFAFI